MYAFPYFSVQVWGIIYNCNYFCTTMKFCNIIQSACSWRCSSCNIQKFCFTVAQHFLQVFKENSTVKIPEQCVRQILKFHFAHLNCLFLFCIDFESRIHFPTSFFSRWWMTCVVFHFIALAVNNHITFTKSSNFMAFAILILLFAIYSTYCWSVSMSRIR